MKRTAVVRGVVAIVLLVAYGTLLGSFVKSGTNVQPQTTVTITTHGNATAQSVENFGPVLTLEQAHKQIGFNFTLPKVLPNGLVLQEIRGMIRGQTDPLNQVVLLFTSPSLPKLGYPGVSMIISFTKGGVGYYPHSPGGPMTFQNVTISGHPGSGWDPNPYSKAGGLDWQSGNVHCTITSFLVVSLSVGIAQQLNT